MTSNPRFLSISVTVTPSQRHLLAGVTVAIALAVMGCGVGLPDEVMEAPDAGAAGSGAQVPDAAVVVPLGPFPIDCSATANQMTPRCARPSLVPAGTLGEGPATVNPGSGNLHGGFIDGARLIAAVAYSGAPATGYVLAVDLATGNRTMVSGYYNDPANGRVMMGAGPDWGTVHDVQRGPDGFYAITSVGVYRVDPANGMRTLVIDHANTATRCTVGTTRAIPRKDELAVGPDKSIYLALSNSPAGTGTGLVAVKAGVCRIVSLGGGPTGSAVGSGATMTSGYFRSIRFHEAKIWAVEFQSQSLMTIDPANGARVRVSASGGTPVGTGDADVGVGWFGFEPAGTGVVYTTEYDGLNRQLNLAMIDPNNGNRRLLALKSGPANKGGATYPPLWVHPTQEWLVVGLDNSIIAVDIGTGQSYTLSR